jgi:CHAT domain-containing protein
VGDRQGEAVTLDNIGDSYEALGDRQKALDYYGRSLSILRAIGDRGIEAGVLGNVALLERDAGNLNAARANVEAAIAIIESLRTKIINRELRSSYFAKAEGYYEFYIDLLMKLHQQNPKAAHDGESLQVSEQFRARSLLDTLAEAGADVRQGVDAALVERERNLQQRLNATAQNQMKLLSGAHTKEQADALAKELEALTLEYQQVETQIRQKSPRYAALTQPQTITLKEIQTQVLDANTLLLEYSLGKERSYVWAVTPVSMTSYELPQSSEIEIVARRFYDHLNARNKRVPGETKEQWNARVRQADKETPEAAADLSRIVLTPVATELGKKRLVIVADGVLQYIPFASLPVPSGRTSSSNLSSDNYQPLIAEHEIVSLPSASALSVLRREVLGRRPAPKTVVVLADPVFAKSDSRVKRMADKTGGKETQADKDAGTSESVREIQLLEAAQNTGVAGDGMYVPRLPGTRQEAQEIIAMVAPSERKLALDFAASRETAASNELSQYRYVHFSTHGFLNSVHPELSGLVFSLVNENGEAQDGFLRAHEVFNLKLNADLVVLSACQTGIGKEVKGEGLVSLTRGFMYAGAPRVVVSLWSVSETGTTELMVRFYREMLKEGKPPAAALRAAQLSLMKEKRWSSPFFWAPFVLQGEWR